MAARVEKARGFNTSLVLAPQVVEGMGGETKTARILGSVETVIAHRVNTPECELWLAARVDFRDPSRLAALFDHDITGVDLDSRLDGRFLMPWKHDEPARMGSHACVLPDREVQCATAIHADALAYEGVG